MTTSKWDEMQDIFKILQFTFYFTKQLFTELFTTKLKQQSKCKSIFIKTNKNCTNWKLLMSENICQHKGWGQSAGDFLGIKYYFCIQAVISLFNTNNKFKQNIPGFNIMTKSIQWPTVQLYFLLMRNSSSWILYAQNIHF